MNKTLTMITADGRRTLRLKYHKGYWRAPTCTVLYVRGLPTSYITEDDVDWLRSKGCTFS